MKHTTAQFDFAAKPKVTNLKPKYRQQPRQDYGTDTLNLMNDPRVVRGNTYAAIVTNKNQILPPPPKKIQKQSSNKLKNRPINFDTGFEPATPRAVEGRDHFTTQTQPFVQTLRDKPIQYQKESQTDFFLDRPVQRQFDPMKGKTGIDRHTQIEENDPQLFNFDYQVQPIIQALLSKVTQTARIQLYEQQQLAQKQAQKKNYQRQRHARLAQAQKLQANQTRLKQQYQRRQLQYKTSNQQEKFAQKKVIGRILSKQYLRNLKPNTYMILQQEGFFRQPLETDLYQNYNPWIYQQIIQELRKNRQFGGQIQRMITQAKQQKMNEAKKFINAQNQRRQKIIDAKQAKKNQKIEKKQRIKRQKLEAERLAKQQAQRKDKQQQEQNQGQNSLGKKKQEQASST